MNSVTSLVSRNPLVSFVVLTYALCWGVGAALNGTPIVAPDGSFIGGILIAALVVTAITSGREGLRDLGRRLVHWRVAPLWYGVVVLLPLVIVGLAMALMQLLGGEPLDWSQLPALTTLVAMLLAFIFLPIGAPLAEEVAWRGFALPRLLANRSALAASLLIGVVWSLWHIPVVLSDPTLREPAPFLLAVVPLAVLFTWIFLQTGGSVLIAVLFHAWYDLVLAFAGQIVATSDYALMWWMLFAVQSVAAVVVVLVARDPETKESWFGSLARSLPASAHAS